MHQGTCSDSVLETVSKTRMDVEIYYLKVDRIAPGLTQIPLCSVGKVWTTSNSGQQCSHVAPTAITQNEFMNSETITGPSEVQMDSFIYLPYVTRPVALETDNPNANCPCGWFTEDGRMLDHVLPPGW